MVKKLIQLFLFYFQLVLLINSSCTYDEINDFQNIFNSIFEIKIFVKSYIPNPLNKNNPEQKEIISFILNSNYKGAIVYFKNYNITTQSSIIPFLFDKDKSNILEYDYYTEDYDNSDNKTNQNSNTYYLEFVLSNKVSFLDRDYEQINNILGDFIGVFNALQGIGKFLLFYLILFLKNFLFLILLLKIGYLLRIIKGNLLEILLKLIKLLRKRFIKFK